MTIRPVSSTIGVSVPSGGGYRWRKIPGWRPGDIRYREPGRGDSLPRNAKAASARQKRLARYCELRMEGKSRTVAAAAIPVCDSTSKAYETAFRDRQRGGQDG